MSKLLLIDGQNLFDDIFFGVQNNFPGTIYKIEDVPASVSSGFLRSLDNLIMDLKPTHIAIAFDSAGRNFRHKLYSQYRKLITISSDYTSFKTELKNLQLILKELRWAFFVADNYEAVDVIATLVEQVEIDEQIIIFSRNKDLLQLINDSRRICLFYPDKRGIKTIYQEQEVEAEYNIKVGQLADYKALVGDRANNFPGVKGIGKNAATDLLNKYSDIQEILENLPSLKKVYQNKILASKDNLMLFRKFTKLQIIKNFNWNDYG